MGIANGEIGVFVEQKKVVGERLAAIADLAEDGSETVTTISVKVNAILAALRATGGHGLIED